MLFWSFVIAVMYYLRHKSSLIYRSHTLLLEFSTNWYIPQVGTWNVACKRLPPLPRGRARVGSPARFAWIDTDAAL